MHTPTLYTVTVPTLAALYDIPGDFAVGDSAYVPGYGNFVYQTTPPSPEPIGTQASILGGFWVPAGAYSTSEITLEHTVPVVPGQIDYRLPIGSYVAADTRDLRVFHDGVEVFGWSFYTAGMHSPSPFNRQPSTVLDVASGIAAAAPFAPGLLTLRWIERIIPIRPRVVSPTFFSPALIADNTVPWQAGNWDRSPNGFTIPQGPGDCVPEVWRVTEHKGGRRHTGPNPTPPGPIIPGPERYQGNGRRLVPYMRGPQLGVSDPNAIILLQRLLEAANPNIRWQPPFNGPAHASVGGDKNTRKRFFRVCYYSPSLRARSLFANETIAALMARVGDLHMGVPPGQFRVKGTIAICAT